LYLNERIHVHTKDDGSKVYKPVANVWLNHTMRRQYIHGVAFDPSTTKPISNILNLWEGYAVQPVAGDWSLLRDHIRVNICSEDPIRMNYLMGWMARMLQYPAEQGEVAVVMRGGEGIGKGTLAKALIHIIGQHGLAISNAKHLVSNFNAHLRDAIFLFADEAFFAGDKSHIGVLKAVITEPYLTVEAKFANAVQMPNFLHVMMASNSEWVVPASLDSRRFFMLEVEETVKNNHEYFGAIRDQMANGGYQAMLYDLLNLDISSFNVRDVPVTKALQDQRVLSLPHHILWWKECLDRGYVYKSKIGLHDEFAEWTVDCSTELLYNSYIDFAKLHGERRLMSKEGLARFMVKLHYSQVRLTHAPVGEEIRDTFNDYGTAIRKACVIVHPRPSGYRFGLLHTARQMFDDATGLDNDWSDVEG
jgi:hypothetical protein